VSLFSFLSKKKESVEEKPGSADMGVPVPSSPETPDIYSDLPSFSEKSSGEDLLPPLKPILRDTMPGMGDNVPNPEMLGGRQPTMPEEDLPVPPQFKYDSEELSPSQPYTVPGIPQPPELPQHDEVPDVPDAHSIPESMPEPAPESAPEPKQQRNAASGNYLTKGPFIRAFELRQIINDTNDLHMSIKLAQDVAAINELLAADASAYERFHKSIENLQRKLMLAERMFMKV
jgi:hypothetical protein